MSERSFISRVAIIFGIFARSFEALRRIRKVGPPTAPELKQKIRVISSNWAHYMLSYCNVQLEIDSTSAPICEEPCLFLANHVSYMDIPALHSVMPSSFVAKKEVRHWLIFGAGAASIGTVFVDRESVTSKKVVAETLATAIASDHKSVLLFPEGTSSPYGKPWKRGAFHIAHEHGFKVQAARIAYRPHRLVTYWGKDTFIFHLWRLLGLSRIQASIEIFPAQNINDVEIDSKRIQEQVVKSLESKLKEWGEEFVDPSQLNI